MQSAWSCGSNLVTLVTKRNVEDGEKREADIPVWHICPADSPSQQDPCVRSNARMDKSTEERTTHAIHETSNPKHVNRSFIDSNDWPTQGRDRTRRCTLISGRLWSRRVSYLNLLGANRPRQLSLCATSLSGERAASPQLQFRFDCTPAHVLWLRPRIRTFVILKPEKKPVDDALLRRVQVLRRLQHVLRLRK